MIVWHHSNRLCDLFIVLYLQLTAYENVGLFYHIKHKNNLNYIDETSKLKCHDSLPLCLFFVSTLFFLNVGFVVVYCIVASY